MRGWIVMLCVSGCVADPATGPGVVGSSADVTTAPGPYVGYRVDIGCDNHFADIGVIGTGAVVVTDIAAIDAAGQDLRTHLVDLASVWGWGGAGLVCEPGVGTEVSLSDWRDVDTVVERAGAWLREHDYALQIGISVSSIPVPVSQ
jgi:hypothetical protein